MKKANNIFRKVLSGVSYYLSACSILVMALPNHTLDQVPFTILIGYIFGRLGYKLWTNQFTSGNKVLKIGIYLLEMFVALLLGSLTIFVFDTQFIANTIFCLTWTILANKYKPSVVINYIKSKINQ